MPEARNMAKILLWTELGHNLQKFRLVGSKFGLSGLQDMIIRRKVPTQKPPTNKGNRQK